MRIECKFFYKELNAKQCWIYDSSVEMCSSDYVARTWGWGIILASILFMRRAERGQALIFLPPFFNIWNACERLGSFKGKRWLSNRPRDEGFWPACLTWFFLRLSFQLCTFIAFLKLPFLIPHLSLLMNFFNPRFKCCLFPEFFFNLESPPPFLIN